MVETAKRNQMIKNILVAICLYIFQILTAIIIIVYLILSSKERTMYCNRINDNQEICYITNLLGKEK